MPKLTVTRAAIYISNFLFSSIIGGLLANYAQKRLDSMIMPQLDFVFDNIQLIVYLLGVIAFFLLWLRWSRDDLQQDLINRLLHIKAAYPGHGNYFHTPVQSTAAYLQVVIRQMTAKEISMLIHWKQFNLDESNALEQYLNTIVKR